MNVHEEPEPAQTQHVAGSTFPAPSTVRHARSRRHRAGLAGVLAGLALIGGVVYVATHHGSDTPRTFPGSSTTRLVGARGVVLAVPSSWQTEIEQDSYCSSTDPNVVLFALPIHRGGIGSCGVPVGASWPAENSVSIMTNSTATTPPNNHPEKKPSGTVAGMPYYIGGFNQTGPGVAEYLSVPEAGVHFTVGAADTSEIDALFATVRAVPAATTTVSVATKGIDDHPVLASPVAFHLRSRIVEIAQPDGWPGELLQTVPPVGTPVAAGTVVTLEYSAGDLYDYVNQRAFDRQGWQIRPADRFDPPISRLQAFDAVPHHEAGGNYGIFLRRLDGRLVWLVALNTRQGTLQLTAIDANTRALVTARIFPERRG